MGGCFNYRLKTLNYNHMDTWAHYEGICVNLLYMNE